MRASDVALLLAVLAVLQGLLWLAARGLGSRLPARVAAAGLAVPLLFLSPWILGSRLLVPSDELSLTVPGAPALARPPSHGILNDVIYQLLPWELEVRHALRAGRLPLWSHALEGGSSPWSNPQAGALSPVAALSRPLAIQHHLLAGLALKMMIALEGAWLLLRALGSGRAAAWLGGLGVSLGGAIQPWALFPPSTTAAWIPWLALAGIRLLRRRPSAAGVAVTACLGAAILLSGNPEVAAAGGAFAALCALLLARPPLRWRSLGASAGAAVLALALAAPVMLPFLYRLPSAQRIDEVRYGRLPVETLDWRPGSWFAAREAELLRAPLASQAFGRPYRDVYRGSLNWAEAGAGYAGLVTLAGLALVLGAPGCRRALPFVFAGVAALLLAAGFIPLRALVEALPGADLLAFPRLLLISTMALTLGGALGIDGLLRGRTRGVLLLLVAAPALLSLLVDRRAGSILLWAGILGALVMGRRRPQVAAAVLGGVLLLDLGTWAWLLHPRADAAAFYPQTPAIELLRGEVESGRRLAGEDLAMYPSLAVVYGFDEVRPHNPLAPRDYAGVLRNAFGFAPSRRYFGSFGNLDHPLLDFLAVEAVVSYSTRPGAPGYRRLPRTLDRFDAGEFGTFRLLRNPDPLPRAFVPTGVDVLRPDQLEEWIRRLDDPRRVALTVQDAGGWRPDPRRWRAETVRVLEWRRRRVRLAVDARGEVLLATSLPGPRGWRARAGAGRDLETMAVNGAFLGVRVPAGAAEVELAYRPRGFVAGSLLAGLAGLALAGILAPAWRRRGKRTPARPRGLRVRPAWAGALVMIWLGLSLLVEIRDRLEPYLVRGPRGFTYRGASSWRLASPPVEELERFLSEAAAHVPEGAGVVFYSRVLGEGQTSYRTMWASYLLPRHDVLPPDGAGHASYWIAYKTRLRRPGLETVWEADDGAVYRLAEGATR